VSLPFALAFVLSIVRLATPVWTDFQADVDAADHGDWATALRKMCSLAEQGVAAAQHNLGTLYFEGSAVPQDYALAPQWYEKAAAQGNADAQISLSLLYEQGRVRRRILFRPISGTTWRQRTESKRGAELRDALATQMTPSQIAEAQKLSRE
jgi:uncharacterized protein